MNALPGSSNLPSASVDRILSEILRNVPRASDINFTVGKPPQAEVDSELREVKTSDLAGILSPGATESIALGLMVGNPALGETLQKTGACDCAYAIGGHQRFRVNIFRVAGNHSIVLRALPTDIPSLDSLSLPKTIEKIPELRNGLALVTGSTGSGKSTTLAAIIDRINSTRAVHVVTLEDPVEFLHPQKKATLNQREQGIDFANFADGLKAALRQAPKVILVGEMRDRETVEIALKAAETGHLVLSTLHTIDAGQTINRIVGLFEQAEQALVRMRLAQTIRYVVGQRLIPKKESGRVAIQEIMGMNLRVRELILQGESQEKTFYEIIADSKPYGMQTFDQHLIEFFSRGDITRDMALAYASDASIMGRMIDDVLAEQGASTSDLGDLHMVRNPRQGF